MLTGTSCRFSDRFWAVTTTSSSATGPLRGGLRLAAVTAVSMDEARRAAVKTAVLDDPCALRLVNGIIAPPEHVR